MKIEFDTQNPNEIRFVAEMLTRLANRAANDNTTNAQPEVASNTGSTVSGSSPTIGVFPPEDSGVSGDEAATAASTPAVEKRRGRPAKVKLDPTPEPDPIRIQVPARPSVPEPEPTPEPVAAVPVADKALTMDDVRTALESFIAKHGLPDGKALLKTYNAGRISELAVEAYAEFIQACSV